METLLLTWTWLAFKVKNAIVTPVFDPLSREYGPNSACSLVECASDLYLTRSGVQGSNLDSGKKFLPRGVVLCDFIVILAIAGVNHPLKMALPLGRDQLNWFLTPKHAPREGSSLWATSEPYDTRQGDGPWPRN